MDSRASTSSVPVSQKPKPLAINTTNHAALIPSKFSPSYTSFRSSPLNPHPSPSPSSPTDKRPYLPRLSPTFPASRPLRPFPSIAQSLAGANPARGSEMYVRHDPSLSSPILEDAGPTAIPKRSPKTIEISSKWRGGFFVLGMTQAEFSRRD